MQTRRQFIHGLGGLSLFLLGCTEDSSPIDTLIPTDQGRHSRTGVPGLQTPQEIINNSNVASLVSHARNSGLQVVLNTDINPPNIEGRYSMAGEIYYPVKMPIPSGIFKFYNQTYNNKIDADYSQLIGQTGVSKLGQIIRGQGNQFTVFSIMDITHTNIASARVALIIDGAKDSQGIFGTYIAPVIETYYGNFEDAYGSIDFNRIAA